MEILSSLNTEKGAAESPALTENLSESRYKWILIPLPCTYRPFSYAKQQELRNAKVPINRYELIVEFT